MRPRIPTLVFGVVNLRARCPYCRSHFVRESRESYDGSAARLLRLAAYRCRDCKRHFAVPPYARVVSQPGVRALLCPSCGGQKTVDSATGPGSWVDRFLGRRPHRCLSCRERFVVTDRRHVLSNLLLLGTLLAGIALGASLLHEPPPWMRSHPSASPPGRR